MIPQPSNSTLVISQRRRWPSISNDAVLRDADGECTIQGDPTDAAFLVAERKVGITQERKTHFTRVDEVPFTSERKLMSSIEVDEGGRDGSIS